ncbi:hypothetical protein [Cognatiluteimonas telluris]|jgi:hypothetical protein|uniref:hypothetical protein n=1 Tax=Cognatiluteimonas telluris TaxID=1104775 RepID=UPI00140AA099|nr:hypothetical protein [Lysobacter telluris]
MNAVFNAGCTIIAGMLLAGCATTREPSANAMSRAPASQASQEIDTAYVQRVEREARRDDVDVQWVHPPTKAASSSSDSD